jgi:capsular exopolysaccharide synthesis family protein
VFIKNRNFEEPSFEILSDSSSFELKEAYNSLCTNVLYLPIQDRCKKIAVTSSVSGEGKTCVAVNLAISLAANLRDKRVLIVEADMRAPRVLQLLQNYITKPEQAGLSDYLSNALEIPPILNTTFSNLHVILAGNITNNPAGLMCSEKMSSFISDCEEKYDYVVFDTPPINSVSDSILLINKVNGYILASRTRYSKLASVDTALETLKSVGAEVFGIVLTDNK